MTDGQILKRLRLFLWIVSAGLLLGTLLELALIDHTQDPVQLIPFLLSGLGLILIGLGARWPARRTLLLVRGGMLLIIIGSVFGIYEHIANNVAFELEIRPNAAAADLIAKGLGGANPLLAPGMLALAAVLALAATYHHPSLAAARPSA
jgi:hypothetical protein